MKQKTLLFIAVAALATLASCSQDEITGTNPGKSMDFRASISKPSRATVATTTSLNAFKVTAFKDGEAGNYFTNLPVTKTGGAWSYDGTYYWPGEKNTQLNFYAYAPTSAIGTVDIKGSAQTITGFTPNATASTQQDLIVAYTKKSSDDCAGGAVNLNFRHALSQIVVQAKCTNSRIKVVVKGVKIGGIPSTGKFTFPTTVTDDPETGTGDNLLPQNCWEDVTTSATANYTFATPGAGTTGLALTNNPASLMGNTENWMLIPQQLKAWNGEGASQKPGAYLAVLCQIYSIDNESGFETLLYPSSTRPETDLVAGGFAYSAVPISTNWEPGKKYIYTLEFSRGGQVDPEDPDHGGEEILGGPIEFTISVDTWVDREMDYPMQ